MDILFNNVLTFEFRKYVQSKFKIFMKYEKFEDINVDYIDNKLFVKQLDKYLLHTIEEIEEAHTEYNHTGLSSEFVEELTDILSYTGTTLSFITENLIANFSGDSVNEHMIIKNTHYNSDYVEGSLLAIMSKIISCRKVFPERKWHKPAPICTSVELEGRLEEISMLLESAMEITLSLLVSTSNRVNINYEKIINEKHQLIIDLPLVKE